MGGKKYSGWQHPLAEKKKDWDKEPVSPEHLRECFRVSKHQIVYGVNHWSELFPVGPGRIIWDKQTGSSDQSDAEILFISGKSRVDVIVFMWKGKFQGRSILMGHVSQGNMAKKEKRFHPTQKSQRLNQHLIQKYFPDVQSVLDPFSGSGSIARACQELGIDCLAIEKDEEYFHEAEKQLELQASQLCLF